MIKLKAYPMEKDADSFLRVHVLSCLVLIQYILRFSKYFYLYCICISLLLKWPLRYELHMKHCDSWINSEPTEERREIAMLFE